MTANRMWTLAPGSLPIAPTFMLQKNGIPHMMYGAIRGPRNGPPLWTQWGLNIATIPDFCGGLYVTATNVVVMRYSAMYANVNQQRLWETMLSTDDLFEWDAHAPVLSRIPVGEWSRWPTAGGVEGDMARALEKIAALSLAARLMTLSTAWRRRSINFWDTKTGATRQMMRWMYNNTHGGVHVPEGLHHFYADHADFHEGREIADPTRNSNGATHLYHTYPSRYITGMYLRNANSGNMVACSTLATSDFRDDLRRPLPITPDLPEIRVTYANPVRQVFSLASRGWAIAPNRFYAM